LPNPVFQRQKNDLHTVLTISLKEALLGFEKEIQHLDGHIVKVKKDTVVQPGDIIKVRGEGMPVHQSSERGDLFVKIEILLPALLTDKQKQSNDKIFLKNLVAKLLFEKRSKW
jgi:DnaJ family protein B protein 11